jgi:hypothetical protein
VTRSDVIAAATSYLDALVSHDAESARLADDVRRVGNGRDELVGADALRSIIRREPVGAIGPLDWVVEDATAAVLYELDADMTRANGSDTFAPADSWLPAYIAERFTVVDGLITRIDVLYAAGAKGAARPPRPERYPRRRGASAPPRDQVVEVASAYLGALVSHDGSAVPLAPGAWRVENGHNSGDSGPEIERALAADIMQVVTGVRDLEWTVEDDTAIVFYTLDVDLSRLPGADTGTSGGSPASAKRLAERFRVHDGQLAEIEVVIPATDI